VLSIAISVSVCMSVCLSTRISQKPQSKFHQIFCMLPLALAQTSFDGNAMLCTSGFVDDVMFLYNGPNRPESKTTRVFCPIRQRQVAAREANAVSDCIVFRLTFLHVIMRLTLAIWGSRPHLIHGSSGARLYPPIGMSIGPAVLQSSRTDRQSDRQPDTQTDHATSSVGEGHVVAMRPNNNKN